MKTLLISPGAPLYEDVLKIRTSVFIEEQGISRDLEIDEHELNCVYFLTYFNGQPASTGRLRQYKDFIKFERIATLKEYRGKGVGAELLIFMLNYARTHFPDKTPYMHAQESSIGFYEKLGWRKAGDPFVEADIPHQAMKYPID